MTDRERNEITRILAGVKAGSRPDQRTAGRLFDAVYDELRQIAGDLMRRERSEHTLQATAVVSEAYLRLVDDTKITWQNRAHFFGIASRAMRQILVEHARNRSAAKRGGGWNRVSIVDALEHADVAHDLEILEVDRILTELSALDERAARIVELRVFAGLTVDEVAEALGISVRTVHNDWRVAKMWLARRLSERDAR